LPHIIPAITEIKISTSIHATEGTRIGASRLIDSAVLETPIAVDHDLTWTEGGKIGGATRSGTELDIDGSSSIQNGVEVLSGSEDGVPAELPLDGVIESCT
jgi:hypothetical protein